MQSVSGGKPKFLLSEGVAVGDQFRKDFNRWAISVFGREPDTHVIESKVTNTMFVSKEAYDVLWCLHLKEKRNGFESVDDCRPL